MQRVIVIGAGPAGLAAAYELVRRGGIYPVVLEATPHIGGISRTAVYKNNRMDLGGHRFFTKDPDVMTLWKEFMPLQGAPASDDLRLGRNVDLSPGGPDPETAEHVMLLRQRLSRILYRKRFFDYPIRLKRKTLANLGLKNTIAAGFGMVGATLFKRREVSLEDFYINRFGKPLYRMFFEDYTEKVWGIHPARISPEWGAQRVKGVSLAGMLGSMLLRPFGLKRPVETSLIEQFHYPKKGPGQLYERMASEIERLGGEVLTRMTVTRLEKNRDRITAVHALDHEGREIRIEAEAVFSSMAIKDLVAAMGNDVPNDVQSIASALPYRDFVTVGVLAKRMAIPNESGIPTLGEYVPDCWIYIQEKHVRMGRLQIFNNWSPYLVDEPDHTVWIGLEYFCSEGDDLWNRSDSAMADLALEELEAIGMVYRTDVLDLTVVRVQKAYPAYFGSYDRFGTIREYLASIGNLYCIGRNGQHRYNNMDHSILTAMTAVKAYLDPEMDKDCIWKVNTEGEYHETTRKGHGERAATAVR